MRVLSTLCAASLAGALALFLPAPSNAGEKDNAGAIFKARCANCHSVPDTKIRTDLAWLDQVNRTS